MPEYAELICIHSLKNNWHKGYGSMMMDRVLGDVKAAGYSKIMLWVFDSNVRAIRFYEKHGFTSSGRKQPVFSYYHLLSRRKKSTLTLLAKVLVFICY